MLKQVAEGIFIHASKFVQSKSIIVQGRDGVLLIDPGITGEEIIDLANDIQELGQSVVAGFSTHPHWDHLLWHAKFGKVPRYSTARCAVTIQDLLSKTDWKAQVAKVLPSDISKEIPIDDLFGLITGLPVETEYIPWDGPKVRIIEHQAHASGHAALLIKEPRVLIAGDMLSDILIPFLDLKAADPIGDYLAALELLEGVADDVNVFIAGHGSIGNADQMRERVELDRAYVEALRNGDVSDDPRLGPSDTFGKDGLLAMHKWQSQQLIQKRESEATNSRTA